MPEHIIQTYDPDDSYQLIHISNILSNNCMFSILNQVIYLCVICKNILYLKENLLPDFYGSLEMFIKIIVFSLFLQCLKFRYFSVHHQMLLF